MEHTEIGKLILKHLQDDITEEEEGMLQQWLDEKESNRLFFNNITNSGEFWKEFERYQEIDQDRLWKKLVETGLPVRRTKVITLFSNTWKYAAVGIIAIVITVGGYLLWFRPEQPQKTVAKIDNEKPIIKDLAPGKQNAILTLSNGEKIRLDSGTANLVMQQGNTRVVNKEGQLAYSPSGRETASLIYNTLTTAKGQIYPLVLSDGSKVWLNAASSIRFPVAFIGRERKVEITGEAYFEVAKDASKPFKVYIKPFAEREGTEVEVLGTEFNINSYADEQSIKTSLLTGRVKLKDYRRTTEVILKPGEQAAVSHDPSSEIKILRNVDVAQAIAWKNGYFQFESNDLQAVMRQLARWYDVEIVYEGIVPKREFSGKINRNLNASELLEVLEDANIHFRIEGKKIIVIPE